MAARLPGGRIPEAYRELLAYGGRKLGGVYGGVDISYEMTWALLSHGYRDIPELLVERPRARAPNASREPLNADDARGYLHMLGVTWPM